MSEKYLSIKPLAVIVVILLSFSTNACADQPLSATKNHPSTMNQHKKTISVKIPKNTAYFIAVDKNGRTIAFKGINKKGKAINSKPCAVCTAELSYKYGKSCDKLRADKKLKQKVLASTVGDQFANLPFCASTHNVEVLGLHANFVLQTSFNPDCLSKIEVGGRIIWTYPENCAH